MKQLLLASFFVFLALPLWAQDSGDDAEASAPAANATATKGKVRRLDNWNVGVSLIQWSEELRMRQFGVTTNGVANLSGFMVSAQRDYTYLRWGWSWAAHLGSGKANGGNSPLYDQNKISFTMLGASARVFYRVSGRINFGTTLLIFNRMLEWPSETNVTAESGKNPNVTALADLNLRLNKDWELYQGLGHVGEGGTLWRIGANYRF